MAGLGHRMEQEVLPRNVSTTAVLQNVPRTKDSLSASQESLLRPAYKFIKFPSGLGSSAPSLPLKIGARQEHRAINPFISRRHVHYFSQVPSAQVLVLEVSFGNARLSHNRTFSHLF